MIIFNTLLTIFGTYLLIYCINQLFFLIQAKKIAQYFEMQEKTRSITINKNKMCVVIYATNSDKEEKLIQLSKSLENQSYDRENYDIHVIYQSENPEQDNLNLPSDIIIHKIENIDYFSKDKAVNLFLQEVLMKEDQYDVFVFIGIDRIVGAKYLENINRSILEQGAYVGTTICTNNREHLAKQLKTRIISSYLKYSNRISKIVRTILDLPFVIDGDNFAITSKALREIGYVGIEDKNSELDFSLDLVINDINLSYSPYIITGVDIKDFDFSNASINHKISLFLKKFPNFIFRSLSAKEFLFCLIKPNSLMVILTYFLFCLGFFYAPNNISNLFFYSISVFLILNLVLSFKIAELSKDEIISLLLFPFCLFWQKLKIFIHNLTIKSIIKSQYEEENVNSATINSVAYNGKKNVNCKIDLVSEDGMKKVVYREGNRFIPTDSFIRMCDAMQDMINRLKYRGITLKTCLNCQYYKTAPDGTLDCLSGKCGISNSDVLIWNGCQYFSLKEENNQII